MLTMGRIFALCLAMLCTPWVMAAEANWQVYQRSPRLELAIDRSSIAIKKGMLHFRHQERFRDKQYEKPLNVYFFIRRMQVVVNCDQGAYAFISSDYFDQQGKNVWSTLSPLAEAQWQPQEAEEGSIAFAMVNAACTMIRHPAYTD